MVADLRIGAAYIRVSTDDQLEYSPASQLDEIRKYAKAHDILLPNEFIFVDEGISGRTTDKRTEFNRMIGTAKTKPKPFDVILLWKFSRFARSREDSILYKSMLRRDLAIDVISISEPVGDDKMSIIIEAIIEAMDEYYSINLAEEVRRGMTQRAKQGKPNSYAPIGYRMIDGQYAIDPDTAPIVRKVYDDFIAGKGILTISHELTALGVRSRFGNPIDNRAIKYILRNPVYLGKVRWTPSGRTRRKWDNPDTLTIDSDHPPIITAEAYETAQRLLDEREIKHGRYAREDGQPFALKGLVRCSCCGATLTRQKGRATGKGGPSLQCHNYSRGSCPESHSISIAVFTAAVLQQIEDDFSRLDFGIMAADGKHLKSDNSAELIARQRAREMQKLERIREAYEAGIDTLDEYRERKAAIEARIAAIDASAPPPTESITPAGFAAAHKSDLDLLRDAEASEEQKNDSLRGFVRNIIFDRKNSTFTIQYYA
ncbi:recombinase family protein [Agathobaculum sp. NTUH-O15-33]|uniref:recombinase family protein n=1 Tax=Agathobaculum sp. NTUH-O15-33 TaxID=3079302 RepID=UPI0029583D88|nr:recombinase family protein [Agathobaculum sp. NTUH-O15-33]WNX85756.1 recombinase family protein [Agathobaculum sp. NTUH-O15-33]